MPRKKATPMAEPVDAVAEPAIDPIQPETEVAVTVVTETRGLWRLQWTDAVGRLRQSLSPIRLERSTLSSLESLPPYGDDLEAVLVDIIIPVSAQVATLHYMNVWQVADITYRVLRDMLASQAREQFIALEDRVRAAGA